MERLPRQRAERCVRWDYHPDLKATTTVPSGTCASCAGGDSSSECPSSQPDAGGLQRHSDRSTGVFLIASTRVAQKLERWQDDADHFVAKRRQFIHVLFPVPQGLSDSALHGTWFRRANVTNRLSWMIYSYRMPGLRNARSTAWILWLLLVVVVVRPTESAFHKPMPPAWGSNRLFRNHCTTIPSRPCRRAPPPSLASSCCLFMSGYGIASNYSWTEEALEIEVTVQVPPGVKAKDVKFTPGITSIDLRVKRNDNTNHNNIEHGQEEEDWILLDGKRKLRGRVSLDGTYWVFSDRKRSITVTLEKYFPHSSDDMQVLDYDWKGLYPGDEHEVSERKYDEPEVLNVREYAASLGVDIDNINRSMVDETMFSSGLNLTKRALDQLTEKGYLMEVTQQVDGSEYQTNPETGQSEPFSFNNREVAKSTNPQRVKIPFIDTASPWAQAVPVTVDPSTNKTSVIIEDELRQSLKSNAAMAQKKNNEDEEETASKAGSLADPIEQLTVKRLKEILRAQGLKVSGNKEELQERLRNQVNGMLNEGWTNKGNTTNSSI